MGSICIWTRDRKRLIIKKPLGISESFVIFGWRTQNGRLLVEHVAKGPIMETLGVSIKVNGFRRGMARKILDQTVGVTLDDIVA